MLISMAESLAPGEQGMGGEWGEMASVAERGREDLAAARTVTKQIDNEARPLGPSLASRRDLIRISTSLINISIAP